MVHHCLGWIWCFSLLLRTLADAILKRIDSDQVIKSGELIPGGDGGDIRTRGNAWIRAAYRDSKLDRVPRESQIRQAVRRVVKKKHLRSLPINYCKYEFFSIRNHMHVS